MESCTASSSSSGGTVTVSSSPNTVYVTVPQHGAIIPANSKAAQSVIQQNQASVIQSPTVQTVQVGKGGNVILLKGGSSVIQSTPGLQVLEADPLEDTDRKHQRQILVRRPSYRKIFNDIADVDKVDSSGSSTVGNSSSPTDSSGGETATPTLTIGGQEFTTASLLKVIPASSLQLATTVGGTDNLQTIAMSGGGSAPTPGTILQYSTGGDGGAQFIMPVGSSELSGLKFTSGGNLTQGVVLAATPSPSSNQNNSSTPPTDAMGEEASKKREIRLYKNREAARECRAKKKEYIKCLENRVAVLENQNKALIEELKNLKSLYCNSS